MCPRLATLIAALCLLTANVAVAGHALLPELSGARLNSSGGSPGSQVSVSHGAKGTVLVFLSATCPCSHSHIGLLKRLSAKHPEFNFFAVNSNANEPVEVARAYFEAQGLPFPVLRDRELKIADAYHASKTPHAFVLDLKNEVVYRGGVTNSSKADQADKLYLENALNDIEAGRPVTTPESRTLGCVISRGD